MLPRFKKKKKKKLIVLHLDKCNTISFIFFTLMSYTHI